MPKKPKITEDDIIAFKQAVQGTKPLPQRKARASLAKPKSVRPRVVLDEPASFFDGGDPRENIQADDYITFKRDGVANKTLRNLGKGQYNVEAVLDLHRKTVEQARIAVNQFLHACLTQGIKCAIIVHGKGKPDGLPILKNQVNHWLQQAEPVLAFCGAEPRHGGNGAVYVLLKSVTKEKLVE